MNKSERISTPLNLGRVHMQFGSDYHYTIGTPISNIIREILADYIPGNTLCIHGDIFNNPQGCDTSEKINQVLKELATHVSQLIFVPGNHDLRGRNQPWKSFVIPENTLYPHSPLTPLVTTIGDARVCIAHLFFDFSFIHTDDETLSPQNMKEFYESMPDGKHMMNGETSIFEPTKQALREVLETQSIDVVITHVPIHPSIASIVGNMNIKDPTVQHIFGEAAIIRHIEEFAHPNYLQISLEDPQSFMDHWNRKGCMLGANVLRDLALPKPLVSIYGHNHQGNMSRKIQINGHDVILTTGPQPWLDRTTA